MKAAIAFLILAASASAAPIAGRAPLAESTLNTRVGAFSAEACYGDWCETKREASPDKRDSTLNNRVGAFSAEACYGDWCETKREVAGHSAKEPREANAKTINTRVGAFSAEACYGDWCETKREAKAEAEN
ncbi:hypothetical protein DPSP01_009403 [Paraphaeosphaeria sporulosa]|uniref:Uncharacterized protein n=1 Tax=Paraphaeosphaeria sporulosa TaxID=1460663 RepID=A0A177CL67_9PLEO|nr:uncharacterized protein CC84DRAFT_1173804 [Paraphaeosphaeria sporulosa]OAG08294.1 hypothetical protein CC84DRAFT_1173804 [Paraphaeosphaeria sporulosa]